MLLRDLIARVGQGLEALDLELDTGDDYRGLCGRLGFSRQELDHFKLQLSKNGSPTRAMLSCWEKKEGSTVEKLISVLKEMHRDDMVTIVENVYNLQNESGSPKVDVETSAQNGSITSPKETSSETDNGEETGSRRKLFEVQVCPFFCLASKISEHTGQPGAILTYCLALVGTLIWVVTVRIPKLIFKTVIFLLHAYLNVIQCHFYRHARDKSIQTAILAFLTNLQRCSMLVWACDELQSYFGLPSHYLLGLERLLVVIPVIATWYNEVRLGNLCKTYKQILDASRALAKLKKNYKFHSTHTVRQKYRKPKCIQYLCSSKRLNSRLKQYANWKGLENLRDEKKTDAKILMKMTRKILATTVAVEWILLVYLYLFSTTSIHTICQECFRGAVYFLFLCDVINRTGLLWFHYRRVDLKLLHHRFCYQ